MGYAESEQRENLTTMRDVWSWALSWLMRSTSASERRAKQAEVVEAIKRQLGTVESIEALHDLYTRDSRWCVQVARRLYPADWASLGVHATSAAAFGLRYVELATGKSLDARKQLPRWLGEWAVW